jgi:hypothetical protein
MNINVQYTLNNTKYNNILRLSEYNNPNHFYYTFYFITNQIERILFISGLEYEKYIGNYGVGYIKVYMYNMKEFDKFLKIRKLLYPYETYVYNREEVIKFFRKDK